nr:DUF1178 family protein [uncultured Celeribacter sp.]
MIRYTLKCPQDHRFESWFRSAEAYDTLLQQGQVGCPVCGDTEITKAMMTPPVTTSRRKTAAPVQEPASEQPVPASAPAPTPPATPALSPEQIEQTVAKLRAEIEQNSDYVGKEFVSEARKMHEGDAPARAIYGEAKLDEAKALVEEGVPVLPLPFLPKRKMN